MLLQTNTYFLKQKAIAIRNLGFFTHFWLIFIHFVIIEYNS